MKKGISYNTSVMEACEYIEAMGKVYFSPPKQDTTMCAGYRNPYTGGLSRVCKECRWSVEENA